MPPTHSRPNEAVQLEHNSPPPIEPHTKTQRWRGARVSVPTLLVSDVAGRALSALPPGSPIHLTPSKDVKEAAWKEIQQLRQASAWPKENPERHSMYKTLVAGNKGFADRLAALTEAFSRVSGGKDGAGGRSEDRGTPPTEL